MKTFKIITAVLLTLFITNTAFAVKYKKMGEPAPISLTNPTSFNGTYEVERLIIRDGDKLILDSDNDYEVYDDKGIATINMKLNANTVAVDLIYKVQMVGPAFENQNISKYGFMYDSQTFTAQKPANTSLSKALSSIGMTIYDHEDLIWEMPFEKNKSLILKLEKKSDISTIIDKKPFIYVEE